MRNPNGFGTIRKLSGKRRRPFAVYITTGFEIAKPVPKIDFLEDILSADLYKQVQKEYNTYKKNVQPKAKQVQKCIGYYEERKDAMIALAEYNKNPFDIKKADVTFEDVYNTLYESTIKHKGKSSCEGYVLAFQKCDSIKSIRMREMRTAHMQRVLDQYADMSKSTQNKIVVLFHLIYDFCLENDICEKDYCKA